MAQADSSYTVLRIARWVFLILAYLFAGLNLIFAGLFPLIAGGDPIQVLADGTTIPARLFGLWSVLISTPISFLVFYVPSGLIFLLLEMRDQSKPAGTGAQT